MIAIVILGLGLVLVASMFPIAWQRARDLADFTNMTNGTTAAEATLRSIGRVAKIDASGAVVVPTSFISDFAGYSGGLATLEILPVMPQTGAAVVPIGAGQSSHVRPLLVENSNVIYDPADPYNAMMPLLTGAVPVAFPDLNTGYPNPPGIFVPQVALSDRVIPSLPPLPWQPTSPPPPMAAELMRTWLAQLNDRRFAWDVFYKLDVAYASGDLVPVVLAGQNGIADTIAVPPTDIQPPTAARWSTPART
jgi:hypothetical protein